MTALKEAPEPEVLIEEARRRQRRRRAALSGLAGLIAAAVAVFGITSGGGPPSGSRPAGRGEGSPGAPAASWHQLVGASAYISPGAQVTTVIDWHGELIAAGELSGPGSERLGCSIACNPAVWVDRGGRWRSVFGAELNGSLPNARLVATGHGLLLFQSQEGTHLWRSTNGRRWRAVRLPSTMGENALTDVASARGRVVAILGNRFGEKPGIGNSGGDGVWSSTNDLTWTRVPLAGDNQFGSITSYRDGFLIEGGPYSSPATVVWSSITGLRWSGAAIDTPGRSDSQLATSSNLALLASPIVAAPGVLGMAFRTSSNGRTWSSPTVISGHQPAVLMGLFPSMLSVDGGFLAFGSNHLLGWSRTGRHWSHLSASSLPPAAFQAVGEAVDGDSLLVLERASRTAGDVPAQATTVWRLDLGHA